MTAIEELEMLAKDTEELAIDSADDKGMQRALLSIVYRIRHAARRIHVPVGTLPTRDRA